MISLLIPSRNRPNNVKTVMNSILNTVSDTKNIEVLFKFDDDDKITCSQSYLFDKPRCDIKTLVFERSENLNRDYYNHLAKEAKGDILWSIGDDCEFHTKDWDKIVTEKVEDYLKDKPDRIVYIYVSEKGSKAKHPCFPLITKEAFEVLNMYFHPQLLSWGADRCLWELYEHNSIRRILFIPEVEIEHISYHDGKAEFDKTAQSMKERFFRDPESHNKVSMYIIPQQVKYLEKYIKEYKNVL